MQPDNGAWTPSINAKHSIVGSALADALTGMARFQETRPPRRTLRERLLCKGWLIPILIVLFAGIHLYCPPARVAELEVIPDSVEYAVAAHRFATTGRYEIWVNGEAL